MMFSSPCGVRIRVRIVSPMCSMVATWSPQTFRSFVKSVFRPYSSRAGQQFMLSQKSMATVSSSSYNKLDAGIPSIRLLKLKPGLEGGSIECSLFTASLENPPPYEALSYAWGSNAKKVSISVNGTNKEVTSNLAGALENLRYEHKERTLWVDAVCINQDDVDERNHQVRQMTHIYGSAQQTVVWLGGQRYTPNRKPGAEGLGVVERCGKVIRAQRLDEAYPYVAKGQTPPWVSKDGNEAWMQFALILSLIKRVKESSIWSMIEFLSNVEWWKRGWVVQEVVVAKRVTLVFGQATCDWEDFVATFSLLSQFGNQNVDLLLKLMGDKSENSDSTAKTRSTPTDIKRLDFHVINMDKLRSTKASQKQIDILDLLYMQRRAQCSEKVDKVYSVLGILSPKDRSMLVPDYKRADIEIFREVARILVETTGKLDFLCLVLRLRPQRQRQDLSTWTPDWSTDLHVPLGYQPFQEPLFKAANTHVAQVKFSENMTVMTAKGVCFDRIREVGGESWIRATQDLSIGMVPAWTSMMIDFMTKDNKVYASKSSKRQAWWRTMVAGQVHSPDGIFHAHPAMEKQWLMSMGQGEPELSSGNPLLAEEERREATQLFLKEMVRAVSERRLIFTEKGYIGLAPGNANVGDLVCVLLGGPVPFILRKDNQDDFILVGESYIHGAMNGEIMAEVADGGLRIEDFRMR